LREGLSLAIAVVCEGNDCFVGLATGQGKSLCYQILPSIARELTMVIVISPLHALVADQARLVCTTCGKSFFVFFEIERPSFRLFTALAPLPIQIAGRIIDGV